MQKNITLYLSDTVVNTDCISGKLLGSGWLTDSEVVVTLLVFVVILVDSFLIIVVSFDIFVAFRVVFRLETSLSSILAALGAETSLR